MALPCLVLASFELARVRICNDLGMDKVRRQEVLNRAMTILTASVELARLRRDNSSPLSPAQKIAVNDLVTVTLEAWNEAARDPWVSENGESMSTMIFMQVTTLAAQALIAGDPDDPDEVTHRLETARRVLGERVGLSS